MTFHGRFRVIALLASGLLAGCATNTSATLRSLSDPLPSRVELAATPFFPQDEYQCGPAALATVLQAAEVPLTPDALVAEVYLPGRQGSLQTELIAATRTHGRMPYMLAPTLEDLIAEVAAGRPVLVLQNLLLRSLPAWHYAVVIGYDRSTDELILRSGTTERLLISARKFDRTWELGKRWAIVTLKPGEAPARPDLDRYMSAAAGLEATGKTDAAHAAYSRAQALWPAAALPWLGMANLSHARGNLPEAQRAYIGAIQRDPANVAARNNLAETLAQQGCVADAQREIERAVELASGTSLERDVAATAARLRAMQGGRQCEIVAP